MLCAHVTGVSPDTQAPPSTDKVKVNMPHTMTKTHEYMYMVATVHIHIHVYKHTMSLHQEVFKHAPAVPSGTIWLHCMAGIWRVPVVTAHC